MGANQSLECRSPNTMLNFKDGLCYDPNDPKSKGVPRTFGTGTSNTYFSASPIKPVNGKCPAGLSDNNKPGECVPFCKEGYEFKGPNICGPKASSSAPTPASASSTDSVPAAVGSSGSGVPAGMYCPACPVCPTK